MFVTKEKVPEPNKVVTLRQTGSGVCLYVDNDQIGMISNSKVFHFYDERSSRHLDSIQLRGLDNLKKILYSWW